MFAITDVLADQLTLVSGTVMEFGQNGEIWVEVMETAAPVAARFLRTTQAPPPRLQTGNEVLIAVDADQAIGYILGVVEPYVATPEADKAVDTEAPPEEIEIGVPGGSDKVRVTGRKIYIEASEEIQLKCGDGMILIDKEGKVVVRGTKVLSRARGLNKIKGGAVTIN